MKKKVWLADYLIRQEELVIGYSTAVEAEEIIEAAGKVEKHISECFETDKVDYQITNIGIADDEAREMVGTFQLDPLAVDWTEQGESMTVDEILELGLHDDNTVIEIIWSDPLGGLFTVRGHWYYDKVLEHHDKQVEGFEWREGLPLRITLK